MPLCVLSSRVDKVWILHVEAEPEVSTLSAAEIIEALVDTTHEGRFKTAEVLKYGLVGGLKVRDATRKPRGRCEYKTDLRVYLVQGIGAIKEGRYLGEVAFEMCGADAKGQRREAGRFEGEILIDFAA